MAEDDEAEKRALDKQAIFFSIAKWTHRPRRCSPPASPRRQPSGDGWSTRAVGHYCARMVLDAADRGEVDEAEDRMISMCSRGLQPDSASFNALVSLLAASGHLQRAEAWFIKPREPALHPEFAEISVTASTYDALVVLCADIGDVSRAEKYAADAEAADCQMLPRTYQSLVRVCLNSSQPRRAHHWCSAMFSAGYKKPNKAMMTDLVTSLADTGNAQAANYWLTEMASLGQPLDATTYDYIRAKHPMEIVPTKLSAEGFIEPIPPVLRPAAIGGERRPPTSGPPPLPLPQSACPALLPSVAGPQFGFAGDVLSPKGGGASPRVPKSVFVGSGGLALQHKIAMSSGFNSTKLPRHRDPIPPKSAIPSEWLCRLGDASATA